MSIAGRIADSAGRLLAPAMSRLFLKRPRLFEAFQSSGVHVLANHFYNPVPDTRALGPKVFDQASLMPGVNLNLPRQVELMRQFRSRFAPELDAFPSILPQGAPAGSFSFDNVMYGPVDAEVLYSMVRMFKPRRIIEIGSGHSTRLSAMGILANQREDPAYRCELTCIEPYPADSLRAGFPGLSRLIVEPVERVPLSMFEGLGENDILFIDSSHVLKIGSDVQYEFLEVLPRVGVGALVHVHDVFFPKDYPRAWVMDEKRFWTEQYLLHAFLMFNRAFEVLWCGTAVEHAHPRELAEAFPSLARERAKAGGRWHQPSICIAPASFWMRRTAP